MSDRTRALRFYGPRLLVLMFLFYLPPIVSSPSGAFGMTTDTQTPQEKNDV